MDWRAKVAVLAAAVYAAGCGDTLEPIICTDIFVYGLSVEVVDRTGGQPLADGATLTLRDGDYVESMTETFDGLTLFGAGERAGTYLVTVARDGYHTWTAANVVVTADECHVIPVSLRAELDAIP